MAKKRKAWPPKFKTGLTSVARLSKYPMPLKMVGDTDCCPRSWGKRSEFLYSTAMELKRGGWGDATWHQAWNDNKYLDLLEEEKCRDHDDAWLQKDKIEFAMLQDKVRERLPEYVEV